jgi:hypothetical protein
MRYFYEPIVPPLTLTFYEPIVPPLTLTFYEPIVPTLTLTFYEPIVPPLTLTFRNSSHLIKQLFTFDIVWHHIYQPKK